MFIFVVFFLFFLIVVGLLVVLSQSGRQKKRPYDIVSDVKKIKNAYAAFKKINILKPESLNQIMEYANSQENIDITPYSLSKDGKSLLVNDFTDDVWAEEIISTMGDSMCYKKEENCLYYSFYKGDIELNMPRAVISYQPEGDIYTTTEISWTAEKSLIKDHEIVESEWKNKYKKYEAPGKHKVSLRVKDKLEQWSEWESVEIEVMSKGEAKRIFCGLEQYFKLWDDGVVDAIGKNRFGELGNNSLSAVAELSRIDSVKNVAEIAVGENHTLFRLFDKSVYASGNNDFGQLGLGTRVHSKVIQKIWGFDNAKQIAAGPNYSGVILEKGEVFLWGENESGQVSTDKSSYFETPKRLDKVIKAKRLALGSTHGLCLLEDGRVMGWGANNSGQLGVALKGKYLEPVFCPVEDVFYIAAGANFSVVTLKNGKVITFGSNHYHQLGHENKGDDINIATVHGISNIVKVAAKEFFIVALDAEGNVYTWGSYSNADGTLYKKATKVNLPKPAKDIDVSYTHGFALLEDGKFAKWDGKLRITCLEDLAE